jgi:hypothetical protein
MPLLTTQSARGYGWGAGVTAPTSSFESIASFVFTGAETTVTFSSISATYDHLQIRWFAREGQGTGNTNNDWGLKINNRTTADNSLARMYSTGSSQSGSIQTGNTTVISGIGIMPTSDTTANYYGAGIINLYNASNTTQKKIYQSFGGVQSNKASTDARVNFASHLSQDTARISEIVFFSGTNPTYLMGAGSVVSLYGVKA